MGLTSDAGTESDAERPAVRKRGRPVGDREAKSGELIAAARAVIARDGYAGASLRKVAQQAGCSTGAVTYYFDNKEAMVAAVAHGLFDEFDGWLEAQEGGVDVQALIRNMLLWTTTEKGEAWLVGLQLLVGAHGDKLLAAVFEKRYARFRGSLARLLERGQAQGVVRRDFPAELLAEQMSAMADGWALMFPLEPARFAEGRMHELVNSAAAMLAPSR